jgi:alkylhydroperoxidase/carboxymuconolactone decarboxylase family protein YurZ
MLAEATAIVGLGAAAARGGRERLREALERARGLVPPADIEEYLLQTYLFAGFPSTINAFFTWQAWASESGGREAPFGPEPDQPAEWRARGEQLCRLVYGQNFEALQRRLSRLHPALADWTLVEGYGKVLGRRGPDPARRELAAIGALIAVAADRQLAAHLRGAINTGISPEVLIAATRHTASEWGQGERVEGLLVDVGLI